MSVVAWRGVELSVAQGLEMGAGLRLFKILSYIRTVVFGSCAPVSE